MTNPFLWRTDPRPSIFATDKAFIPHGPRGLSFSQAATLTSAEHEKKTGRSRGTIAGISDKADEAIETRADREARIRRQPAPTKFNQRD